MIKKIFTAIFIILSAFYANAQTDLKLTYDKPADVWTEALPVGNGRLGGMVFGGVKEELIRLNEATLWSGGPVKKSINPNAFENLAKARESLFQENYGQAAKDVTKMQGLYSESYMPMGDLLIRQEGSGAATNYYRDLDLSRAVATTRYTQNGINYTREVFVSNPAQAMVVRISADKPGQVNLSLSLKSQLPYTNFVVGKNQLLLKGRAPSHSDPNYVRYNKEAIIFNDDNGCRGMRFEMAMKAILTGGTVTTDTASMEIKNASQIVLILSAATSFNGFDKCPVSEGKNEHELLTKYLSLSDKKSYADLLAAHTRDYQKFFNRVSLNLDTKAVNKQVNVPTDQRLEAYSKGASDPGLEALYFQYGRYLLISCSRTPNAPANLQGIWNKELRAPWSSNYTTNINLQMNYWPVEVANLSELFEPMNSLIRSLSVTGKRTAEEYYHARGWVVHHNSDIWAMSNPVGDLGKGSPTWANWYMGANWLSRHLWEHYQFTGDKAYLAKMYPIMKGAALFSIDWLVKNPDGKLVTAPSTSPENVFRYGDNKEGAVSVASTMDMGIIRDLFHNVINAGKALHTDAAFGDTLQQKIGQMFPFQVGAKGQLQEWYKDFEDVDPHHRHTSHLYALHPAREISPLNTPELAAAARRTLELRGDDGTGWSLAWKVNMWARLLDGNHAYTLFRNMLRLTKENNTNYNNGGGAYPNLFDAHPPFQIDGNFAGTAGIIEMLLQSQNDEIHLLPAIPDTWKNGKVTGLVARGNFVIDITWNEGQLTNARITSRNGGLIKIRVAQPVSVAGVNAKSEKSAIGYTISFLSVKGRTYEVNEDKK